MVPVKKETSQGGNAMAQSVGASILGTMQLPQEVAAPKFRFEYFAGYGRVDPLRLMLTHKGVEFQDDVVTFEEWGPRKAKGDTGEMGALPIYYEDGKAMQQFGAILRSQGIKYGYYHPNDWKTCGEIDQITDTWADVLNSFAPILLELGTLSPEEVKTKTEAIKDGILRKFLVICEQTLERHQAKNTTCKYIVANTMTTADFAIAALVFNILKNVNGPFAAHCGDILDDAAFMRFNAYTLNLNQALLNHLASRDPMPF